MNEQIQKGREAYQMMAGACDALVKSGNWQRVGASDIKLFLDMYTQALLLRLAQAGEASDALLSFIAQVPGRDVLSIGKASREAALNIAHKNRSFAEGTPLLLRCCEVKLLTQLLFRKRKFLNTAFVLANCIIYLHSTLHQLFLFAGQFQNVLFVGVRQRVGGFNFFLSRCNFYLQCV